jgi:excisionase family DNA binding protein
MQYEMAKASAGSVFLSNNGSQQALDFAAKQDTTHIKTAFQSDETLNRLLKQSKSLFNVEWCFFFLKDSAKDELVLQLAPEHEAAHLEPFLVTLGNLARQTALRGTLLRKGNIDQDIRNILAMPLFLSGQMIGVLTLVNTKEGHFTRFDTQLLNLLAMSVATVIENIRLHERVLAERDRIVETEDQARKALAHSLHDGPTQLLSAIIMHLELCAFLADKDSDRLTIELNKVKTLVQQAEHQVRTLLFELRPLFLETHGIAAALQLLISRHQKYLIETTKLRLKTQTYRSDGTISRQADPVEAALFAIGQEAINNAIKHAQADNITLHLEETPAAICATIIDDGAGFMVDEVMNDYGERGSWGLANSHERAESIGGKLTIASAPGQGTRVAVCVPTTAAEHAQNRVAASRLRAIATPQREMRAERNQPQISDVGDPGMDEILTVEEVAKYLKVSRSTIWRWCNQGKLSAFKIGHGWRVHRSEVENFVGHKLNELEAERPTNSNGRL